MKPLSEGPSAMRHSAWFDRRRLSTAADWIAIALVASLPWSTSATGILVVAWLLAALPTLDTADIRRVLRTPAGVLPVALWGLAVAGLLWADVPWAERLDGLSPFHKLLLIPLLMAYFRHSERGRAILLAFLASCTLLLVISWAIYFVPSASPFAIRSAGVPVKDYISQSAMFTICACIVGYVGIDRWRQRQWAATLVLGLLGMAFLVNIPVIAVSRTAFIVAPLLLAVLAFREFGWKGIAFFGGGLILVVASVWPLSSSFQSRVLSFFEEVKSYHIQQGQARSTPAGERLEFWRKSVVFISEAPLIGHGTGSITDQFRRAAGTDLAEKTVGATISANPHNQTFAVAIQLGLAGALLLWGMWLVHFLMFRGPGFLAWGGFVVITQNVLGSLFNSHLFDFTHGWTYVLGVGIASGLLIQQQNPRPNGMS